MFRLPASRPLQLALGVLLIIVSPIIGAIPGPGGMFVFAGGLVPPDSATVVRTEGGATSMTDGPFAETKEQLGGFWVIRAADLDEALAWAEKCSAACMGPVEVRPFQDEPQG